MVAIINCVLDPSLTTSCSFIGIYIWKYLSKFVKAWQLFRHRVRYYISDVEADQWMKYIFRSETYCVQIKVGNVILRCGANIQSLVLTILSTIKFAVVNNVTKTVHSILTVLQVNVSVYRSLFVTRRLPNVGSLLGQRRSRRWPNSELTLDHPRRLEIIQYSGSFLLRQGPQIRKL